MALLNSLAVSLGSAAPDFTLLNTEDKQISPADFRSKKGLLIVFTCNHCPYAKASWPLLIDLFGRFGQEIGFVAVNPNDGTMHPEDSFEGMKEKKVEWGIPFEYLYDPTQETAKAYNAQCTPDPYLYENKEGSWKLFYHGRINDNWQDPDAVQENSLGDAMNTLLKGESAPDDQKPSMGCSIKWKK